MNNRQQRRAAMKKGKRPGETYADVLAKQKMVKEAVDRSVHDASIAIEADIKTQRFLWMAVIALNEAFGFGGERAKRFMLALEEVANEAENPWPGRMAAFMPKPNSWSGLPRSPASKSLRCMRKKCARPDWRMRPRVFSSLRMIRMRGKEVKNEK